jgi:hypothetical protein
VNGLSDASHAIPGPQMQNNTRLGPQNEKQKKRKKKKKKEKKKAQCSSFCSLEKQSMTYQQPKHMG